MWGITPDGNEIAAISIGIAIVSSLVRYAVMDREAFAESKKKMKEHQANMKKLSKSGNVKKLQEAQARMMSLFMENMKHSMKPMLFTFIPFILIFYWLKDTYTSVGVVAAPFGYELGWLGWYLVCVMISSMAFNKVLKIQ